MPLVTSREMLSSAQRGGYAICGFNIENMEMTQAVIEAAEEVGMPIMLQTTPSTVRYAPLEAFAAMVSTLAANARVDIAMHLDHGDSVELISRALSAGYTSAMIDGSSLPFEENITMTKRAVDIVDGRIPVEAELGRVGGKEDDLDCESDTNTDPEQAALFVRRTGVSSLAVSIGTAHGFYVGMPILDKERLAKIRGVVDVPLVLHGASGLSAEDIRECIKLGICKVNFATELRVAFTEGIKEALQADPTLYDPKKLGRVGMRNVKRLALKKLAVCGNI